MKIHIFFEEDNPNAPTIHTDFKSESGQFCLFDLKRYFKHTSIDYSSPYMVRFMVALTLLTSKNINLDSPIIERFYHGKNKKEYDINNGNLSEK